MARLKRLLKKFEKQIPRGQKLDGMHWRSGHCLTGLVASAAIISDHRQAAAHPKVPKLPKR